MEAEARTEDYEAHHEAGRPEATKPTGQAAMETVFEGRERYSASQNKEQIQDSQAAAQSVIDDWGESESGAQFVVRLTYMRSQTA